MRSRNSRNRGRWLSLTAVLLCLLTQSQIISSAQDTPKNESSYGELPNFHQVNARLYRGAQPREGGLQKLTSLGVNTIMFCGTLGAKGGIRPASRFEMELDDPVLKRRMTHAYDIIDLPVIT